MVTVVTTKCTVVPHGLYPRVISVRYLRQSCVEDQDRCRFGERT